MSKKTKVPINEKNAIELRYQDTFQTIHTRLENLETDTKHNINEHEISAHALPETGAGTCKRYDIDIAPNKYQQSSICILI